MDIIWYGQTCFQLKDRKTTVLLDPTQAMIADSKALAKIDIITISNPNGETVEDVHLVDSPGEYEMVDIFVTAAYLPPNKQASTELPFRNNVIIIYMDDLVVCHLGHLSHLPPQNQVETLGNIDILLVPIGGQASLNAGQAAEIINLIEPQVVIPMYYQITTGTLLDYRSPNPPHTLDPLEKFVKEMGLANLDTVDNLRITKSQLPEETQIVCLQPKL